MTKKRFYKLMRALSVKVGTMNKNANLCCKNMTGMRRNRTITCSYKHLWNYVVGVYPTAVERKE